MVAPAGMEQRVTELCFEVTGPCYGRAGVQSLRAMTEADRVSWGSCLDGRWTVNLNKQVTRVA